MKETLIGKINIKDAVVGVVGLGYVGLPLAVEIARAGYHVIGVDLNSQVVQGVGNGKSHVTDVPDEHLAPLVNDMSAMRAFHTTGGMPDAVGRVPSSVPNVSRPSPCEEQSAVSGTILMHS